jgi:hypothetical protein
MYFLYVQQYLIKILKYIVVITQVKVYVSRCLALIFKKINLVLFAKHEVALLTKYLSLQSIFMSEQIHLGNNSY